ncbi:MAG: hypothetical protein IC227_11335 [Enterococcus lacertideformus]|uniref:Uncharacterized protein n=1 Tax=Enterococcus lacertideformus TaxID=2771493 RepID=A0A931AVS5_9ENTE|nr:hypothetical protein [Enterococcus lacertideformus]
MDNGPDREVSKLEDVSKTLPSVAMKFMLRGYNMIKRVASKGINTYKKAKVNKEDQAKRELVSELLAKDKDGQIKQLLRNKPEWNKYLQSEPKGIFSRVLDLILRRKPQDKAIANPRMTTKANLKTKQNFLENLLVGDKDGILHNIIKSDPQLTNYLENPKKAKDTLRKTADQGLNITPSQPLDQKGKEFRNVAEISAHAKKKAAQENNKLQNNMKSRDPRILGVNPHTRRNSMQNVSLDGR